MSLVRVGQLARSQFNLLSRCLHLPTGSPSWIRQESRGGKTRRAAECDREGCRLVVCLSRRRSHTHHHHKKVLSSTASHSAVACV